jgi:Mlc titration factor MtfA (ptsG expression regulator)
MFGFLKRKRRARVRAAPFPPDWLRLVERNVPLYSRLSAVDREELLGHVKVLLAEKHFEGCGGLELTDEIRVTIAAQACLLLLHRDIDYFPTVVSILVYPSSFMAEVREENDVGIVQEGYDERVGEAFSAGVVVLAWDDVQQGAEDLQNGYNVVLHEFAHQLDDEYPDAEGLPLVDSPELYAAWGRVFGAAYARLCRDVKKDRPTVMDEYAATDPAEFFAVATEFFFEAPADLQRAYPELFDLLKEYYRQDPLTYVE